LTRLYDPTSGSIYIQGSPYQEYNVSSLRNYFGTLFQDFQIFAVSVAENILMCEIDEKINDEKRVKEALNFVELEQKVDNLKFGVYTELTREFDNNGAIFSGGEYQKVAIARVFNKNSKVIILDEPSSALDPISEKELFDKMNELASDKAVIFVSHRLSNIVNVDKILFLENGEIKECGTHSELMCMNGLYAEMYRIQADKYMQEIT
jgi:ATP-binding cassette subfamily B protein